MLSQSIGDTGKIEVIAFDSLLIYIAREHGSCCIVKGLRAMSDFEFEFQMAQFNRQMDENIETFFVMASPEFTYLSSSGLKEVASYGGSIKGLVPDAVEAAILAALPSTLVGTCIRGGTPDDARLAGFIGKTPSGFYGLHCETSWSITPISFGGVTCHPPVGATRLYIMEPTPPKEETAPAPGDTYIAYLEGHSQLTAGSCATESRAYELWTSPSGSGQLACMNPYDGRPLIYFTFGKGRYLGFATRDDSDYSALYQWLVERKTFLP